MKIYQVDAFTNEHFKGNPAGVMVLNEPLPISKMQEVAQEMNLSETTFLWPKDDKYMIRYFTPTVEIPLCGHATLAAAHILWTEGYIPTIENITFQAPENELQVTLENQWIHMIFPAYEIYPSNRANDFQSLTGVEVKKAFRSQYGWEIIQMETQEDVAKFNPDFTQLIKHHFGHLMLTAEGAEEDYVVRCFAPKAGINEDPVTGSAQCALTPIWSKMKNKTTFVSKQISRRSGILKTELVKNKVKISGQAITFFAADITV